MFCLISFIQSNNALFEDEILNKYLTLQDLCMLSKVSKQMRLILNNTNIFDSYEEEFAGELLRLPIEPGKHIPKYTWYKKVPKMTLKVSHFCSSVNMLGWALKNGLREEVEDDEDQDVLFCIFACIVKVGNMDVLKRMYYESLKLDPEYHTESVSLCCVVAEIGNLKMLKWLIKKGCCIDEWTSMSAAENGQLEILKYLRRKNCVWDESTTYLALREGHFKLFEWARKHGCPFDNESLSQLGITLSPAFAKRCRLQNV